MRKTNSERQRDRDDRQRALGRKGRKVWATDAEHIKIRDCLLDWRGERK